MNVANAVRRGVATPRGILARLFRDGLDRVSETVALVLPRLDEERVQ